MVARVSRFTWRTNSLIEPRVWESRAPKGSSNRSTDGSVAMARAMATRWRIPPDSWRGSDAAKAVRPMTSSRWPTRSRRSALAVPLISRPKATFSATVRHGYRE